MMPGVSSWFLCFGSADSMWWHRWLRPGFQHCWAFGFSPAGDGGPGRWLVFDPCFDRLCVRLAGDAEVNGWFAAAVLGRVTVLEMPVLEQFLARPRWVVTCAGALAALVGMRRTPLTPWGLACIARSLGAREVSVNGEDIQAEGAGCGGGAGAE